MRRLLLEGMFDHAWSCYPSEAVGFVIGDKQGNAESVSPLPNIGAEGTFFVDPFAQWQALRLLQSARKELLAIYHSHPEGGVGLSASDLHFARQHDTLCMVLQIQRNERRTQYRAYRVTKNSADLVDVRVVAG